MLKATTEAIRDKDLAIYIQGDIPIKNRLSLSAQENIVTLRGLRGIELLHEESSWDCMFRYIRIIHDQNNTFSVAVRYSQNQFWNTLRSGEIENADSSSISIVSKGKSTTASYQVYNKKGYSPDTPVLTTETIELRLPIIKDPEYFAVKPFNRLDREE